MTVTDNVNLDLLKGDGGFGPTGPNSAEVQSAVPFAMKETLRVPKERYYDREFFELEKKHLWPRTWLMAARLEQIPNTGDFYEYEIADNSVLIIRQADGSVKALHNACRHRATELAKGSGRLPGGQIVCPFHGWRWNIDGSSSYVYGSEFFEPECLKPEGLRLRECKVEIWANMVWINMDPNAGPLSDALNPVQELLDGVGVGNMRVKWWKQVVLDCNWKMAQEAFFEGYHVMQTHPQLLQGGGAANAELRLHGTQYTTFSGGHARFQSAREKVTDASSSAKQSGGTAESFIESGRLLAQGQDAMTLQQDVQIFEGLRNKIGMDNPAFVQEAVKALYEYADGAGIPMAPFTEYMRLWGGDIFMFPNFLMLPQYGNCLSYRSRPYGDDPEKCIFDVWSLTSFPEGQEPERAVLAGEFDKDDTEKWGLIPRQDFSNVERQQRGLHSAGYDGHILSHTFEKSIGNMHEELDRKIASGKQS